MKIIGLLGGMSWESTVSYYREINHTMHERLGGLHSARIVMYSVNFQDIEILQHGGKWDKAGKILAKDAKRIEAAGADFLVLCTNTMHKVAPQIEKALKIPLLHVADAIGETAKQAGVTTVGLLGTSYTMEEDFYKDRLHAVHDLNVMIPDAKDRELIHDVIFNELCLGQLRDESRAEYVRIINGLATQGAQGIILGCTEISLLLRPEDSPVPLYDTTAIHARKAVEWALAEDEG
ncbi:aspartate/glutamate racemase family protein [Acidobacteriota bacterium]